MCNPFESVYASIAMPLLVLLLGSCSPTKTSPPPAENTQSQHAGFVGADACRPCHQEIYRTWQVSAHGNAMAEPTPETVAGDFSDGRPILFRGVTYRASHSGDTYQITIERPGEPTEIFPVDLLIGARQAQGLLTRMPDGRYQELPIAVDRNTGEWIEASAGGTLQDATPLDPTNWYYWKSPGRTWNQSCYNCHLSQMAQNYDPETNTFDTKWVDLSINCEACHGPGESHVDFWESSVEGEFRPPEADTTLVKLQGLPAPRAVDACVQCHAKKTVTAVGFKPGDNLHDFYEPALLDDPAIWPDGLFRGEAYTYIGYLQNQCYLKGGLTCSHCHDPHGSTHRVDLITPRAESNQLCARCHPGIVSDPQPHTNHPQGKAGNQCLDCHMPQYELKEFLVEGVVLTDHRLASPVPENSERFGIPNACNAAGCHTDKDARWASDWAQKWYGPYQDSLVARAETIVGGKARNPESLNPLGQLMADRSQPDAVRAAAATLLGSLQRPEGITYLVRALEDSSTLVRSRAALALGRVRSPTAASALGGVLTDPNPFVRVNAAMAVNALGLLPGKPADVQNPQQNFELAFNEYAGLLSGLWSADPGSHVALGDIYLARRRVSDAVDSYARSVSIWPYDPDIQIKLARAQMQTGDVEAAAESLQQASLLRPGDPEIGDLQDQVMSPALVRYEREVKENPTSARAHHNLAAIYAQQGRLDEAIAQFSEAIRLQPDYASAYRNMGLAQANRGDSAAIESLQEYLRLAPNAADHNQIRGLVQRIRSAVR